MSDLYRVNLADVFIESLVKDGTLAPVVIDRQAIHDTLIENDGLTYDTVTNRIMELFAAIVGEETSDDATH